MTHATHPDRHNELLSAALAYAERGLYVIPLHEPLFNDAGECTGCTCEEWKRSKGYERWLKKKQAEGKCRHLNYDPNFECPKRTRGKHPRLADWEAKASKDPAQIIAWWDRWPTANIGMPAGQNGLITFDRDTYKEIYGDDSALFTQADKQTATQISQNGGEHLVYRMPEGKAYTNANNTLPPGIDIRGAGGQFAVEPSIGPTGNQWQWEDGYSILERDPRPLPPALQAILDAAQEKSAPAKSVTFTATATEKPELLRWRTSKAVRELIHNPPPIGQRSEADMKVVTALAYAGATDDEILSVFEHYPIGAQGKYAEAGQQYLAYTIGKARGYVELHPRPDVGAIIDAARLWIRTHSFAEHIPAALRGERYRTDSTDTRVADAILDVMEIAQRLSINVGKKRLAKLAGASPNTALHALSRLAGWLFTVTPDQHGAVVSLAENSRFAQIDPFIQNNNIVLKGVNLGETNEYSPRKPDEPYLTGTSRYIKEQARKAAQVLGITQRQALDEYTIKGLGETCLRVLDALQRCGEMTAQELSEETGKTLGAIRKAVRRLEVLNLLASTRETSRAPKVYEFLPECWRRIDELAPTMRTFTSSSQRENKRLESGQQWALRGQVHAQTPEEKVRFERRFAKLARQRIPHLERLHTDLAQADIERLAYEVDDYKRSPELAAQIHTARAEARAEQRENVILIADLVAAELDAGVTREGVCAAVVKYGFAESTIRAVLAQKRLIERSAMRIGAETLARNIAAYKAAGMSKREAIRELEFAGFIPVEIERAWAANAGA